MKETASQIQGNSQKYDASITANALNNAVLDISLFIGDLA